MNRLDFFKCKEKQKQKKKKTKNEHIGQLLFFFFAKYIKKK